MKEGTLRSIIHDISKHFNMNAATVCEILFE